MFEQTSPTLCQHCHRPVHRKFTLCLSCELRMFRLLMQLAKDLTPLYDSLDATLHPGGHQPTRTLTATAPTPLRLDVLDLLDTIDATAYELWRRLIGHDSRRPEHARHAEDLLVTLWKCAGHPRLSTFPDAGLYLHVVEGLARKANLLLDPPAHRREIGPCDTCSTMLTAGPNDQWTCCPVCGSEQRVQTVKLRRLERLCFDDSRRGPAAEVAKAFTDAGIPVKRNTINQWTRRGKLHTTPQGVAYCDVYRLAIAPTT